MAHITARNARRHGLRQWLCRDILCRAVMGVVGGVLLIWEIVLCVAYATVSPMTTVNAGCAACHFLAAVLSLTIAVYGVSKTFDPGNWTYAFVSWCILMMDFASLCISLSYLYATPILDVYLATRSSSTELSVLISLLVLFVYLLLLWASARPRFRNFFQPSTAPPPWVRPLKVGKPEHLVHVAHGDPHGTSDEWYLQEKYKEAMATVAVPLAKLAPERHASLPPPPRLRADSGRVPQMAPPGLGRGRWQHNRPGDSSPLRQMTFPATPQSAPRLQSMRFSTTFSDDAQALSEVGRFDKAEKAKAGKA